jgi:hypothetical protein
MPFTIALNADSYVREAGPNSNYGTNAKLWVAPGTGTSYITYLKFTVSGLSGPVQSAILRLYAVNGTTGGPVIYSSSNDWTEMGLTWNNRPIPTGTGLDDHVAVVANNWAEFIVTPLLTTGNGTYTFVLVSTSTTSIAFSSKEGGQPPQLVITY